MHRLLQTVTSKSRVNTSSLVSACRNYNYQNQIYNSQFESTAKDAESLKTKLDSVRAARNAQPNLFRFVKAYHQNGHKKGHINPLSSAASRPEVFELEPGFYGLDRQDTATKYSTQGLLNSDASAMTVSEMEAYLNRTFSDKMTIEFEHVQCELEREWIAKEFEKTQASQVDIGDKVEILKLLLKSQVNEWIQVP